MNAPKRFRCALFYTASRGSAASIEPGLSAEQKTKNLRKNNKEVVDHNTKSGNDRITCPFFDEMDAFLRDRPNTRSRYLRDSAAPTYQEDAEDGNSDDDDTSHDTSGLSGSVQNEDQSDSDESLPGPTPPGSPEDAQQEDSQEEERPSTASSSSSRGDSAPRGRGRQGGRGAASGSGGRATRGRGSMGRSGSALPCRAHDPPPQVRISLTLQGP
ncbi:hypothetical protein Bbelb_050740 [Branchiostoma belcheri]|nr:hypothetical protein Bbelb_050740 [Branchiostoma belcheri]